MTKPSNKKLVLYGLIIIIVFIITSAGLAYFNPSDDPLTSSFKRIYPAAMVGSKLVSVKEADDFINLARTMDESTSKPDAYTTFLRRQQEQVLLGKLGMKLASDDLTDEQKFYTQGNEEAYQELIKTYFQNDERLFVTNVVYPEVVESKLQIKYNSDFNLNQLIYQKAESILEQLNQGKKFEDLAKQYSDDKQTGQLGGDLGFFQHGQILPELEKEIAIRKVGEVKDLVITRQGYDIVMPLDTAEKDNQKLWHAKHILIQTEGFEQWLAGQLKGIPVKTFKSY